MAGYRGRRWQSTWRRLRMDVAAWRGHAPEPRTWLFLVGCTNSGTSLLDEIVSAHPEVSSFDREGQFRTDQFPRSLSIGLPRLWMARPEVFRMDADHGRSVDVERMKRQWGAVLVNPGRPVVAEKTPTNSVRTPWLRRHFPNSCFVAVVRDGRAVAEGIRRKTGFAIEFAALQWRRCNEILLEDLAGLDRTLVFRYEEFAADPAGTVRRIFDLAGLDASCVEAVPGGVRVAGTEFPVSNMNERSWNALSAADDALIRSVAGDLLAKLGYAPPGA